MKMIPVEERLPRPNEHVLIRGEMEILDEPRTVYYEAYLFGDTWVDWCGEVDYGVRVTHWLPLSELEVDE